MTRYPSDGRARGRRKRSSRATTDVDERLAWFTAGVEDVTTSRAVSKATTPAAPWVARGLFRHLDQAEWVNRSKRPVGHLGILVQGLGIRKDHSAETCRVRRNPAALRFVQAAEQKVVFIIDSILRYPGEKCWPTVLHSVLLTKRCIGRTRINTCGSRSYTQTD